MGKGGRGILSLRCENIVENRYKLNEAAVNFCQFCGEFSNKRIFPLVVFHCSIDNGRDCTGELRFPWREFSRTDH